MLHRFAESLACSNAESASTTQKAFKEAFKESIRSRQELTTVSGDKDCVLYMEAIDFTAGKVSGIVSLHMNILFDSGFMSL
ncbi:MAG: hypothetical protein ABJQ34_19065 [Paracoccaceae bacterium]